MFTFGYFLRKYYEMLTIAIFNIYYYIQLQSIVFIGSIIIILLILYTFMSACLYLKMDADIEK